MGQPHVFLQACEQRECQTWKSFGTVEIDTSTEYHERRRQRVQDDVKEVRRTTTARSATPARSLNFLCRRRMHSGSQ